MIGYMDPQGNILLKRHPAKNYIPALFNSEIIGFRALPPPWLDSSVRYIRVKGSGCLRVLNPIVPLK